MNMWTAEEIAVGIELIQEMSASKVAAHMTERFSRKITRSSLIGKLTRMGYSGPTHCQPRTIGRRAITNETEQIPMRKKPPPPPKAKSFKTKRWILPQKVPTIKIAPLPARYMPKSTCQYIADDIGWDKCGAESHGPWCDMHKKIVTQPR